MNNQEAFNQRCRMKHLSRKLTRKRYRQQLRRTEIPHGLWAFYTARTPAALLHKLRWTLRKLNEAVREEPDDVFLTAYRNQVQNAVAEVLQSIAAGCPGYRKGVTR